MGTGESRPRVVIVGGSLGGLNAGLWLTEAGCDVAVFERTSEPLEGRGTGIVLHPATIRYSSEHSTLDLDRISVAARWIRYMDRDGTILDERACRYRFTAYNEIYRGLLDHFDDDRYHLGEECAGFEQNADDVAVFFASGRTETCDLLVFADGINSIGRRTLLPDVQPTYAGYVAWRGTIGEDDLSESTFAALHESITYAPMPDSHILSYPIPQLGASPDTHLANWLWYRNISGGNELDDLLTSTTGDRFGTSVPPGFVQQRHLDRLRKDALTLPAPMAELVTSTSQPFLQVIMDLEIPQMAFGRVCIMGDAAFTARPHAAAGTAKAAEDAWQLARAVKEAGRDVTAALARWEADQLVLGRQLVERARSAGDKLQHGEWKLSDPLPFGLYSVGDNEVTVS